MPAIIDETKCTSCEDCFDECPAGAIVLTVGGARVENEFCVDCGACVDVCPSGAIRMDEPFEGIDSLPPQDHTPVPGFAPAMEPAKAKTILILAANPKNTPALRLNQEIREIEDCLKRAQKRDDFTLRHSLAARAKDVRRAMLDYDPNIVHFCGHGSGEEGISFEDETGKEKLVSTEALSGFFKLFANKVECVVLNACYSETQADAIVEYIPRVIGMKKEIGDDAAIEFAIAFYDALGAGESIDAAYEIGCNAIQWQVKSEHLTPVLKHKSL